MSYPSYDLTLNQIIHEAHRCSREHGWWDAQKLPDPEDAVLDEPAGTLNHRKVVATIPEKLMLIVTEVAEAMEAYRDPDHPVTELWFGEKGKPEGLPSELADVVIRIGDLAGALGIDLEAAIAAKMRYNEGRPFRHGGKLA